MPNVASKKQHKESELDPVFVSRADIDAQAQSIKDARELPVVPSGKTDFEAFLRWLKLLTPDMVEENRLLLYVYRLDPYIERQQVDPTSDNNIDVISGTIDNLHNLTEEYFITRHGGGKYKIVVNDMHNKQAKIVLECYLTIPMVQHPPKLDLREVVWDHKNNKGYKSWARANKLIDENNMPITVAIPQDTRVNGVGNPDQLVNAMKLIMDFTKQMTADQEKAFRKQFGAEDSANKGIHDIMLERLKQDDPSKQATTISQLATALKTLMPEKQQSDLASMIPMFIEMMRQQADQANKQFQLMLEVMKSNKSGDNEGGEGRDEVSKLRDIIEIARELKGGNPPTKNVVAEVVDSITPILQPALQIVANVMTLRAGQQAGVTVLPLQNTPPTPKPVTINRQDTIKHTPQPDRPTPNPPNPPTPTPETPMEIDEATTLIQQFAPIIMNKLAREGWEFGAWVAEGFGDAVAAGLAKHGVEPLIGAAKKVPDFWQQVNASYGEAYFRDWVTSLVDYKQIMKKMEMEEEDDELDIKEAI